MSSKIVNTSIIKMSENILPFTGSGSITDDAPKTNRILKMLLPTIFPRAISLSFFKAAVMDVASSGKDVPIAIMVKPTRASLIPKE